MKSVKKNLSKICNEKHFHIFLFSSWFIISVNNGMRIIIKDEYNLKLFQSLKWKIMSSSFLFRLVLLFSLRQLLLKFITTSFRQANPNFYLFLFSIRRFYVLQRLFLSKLFSSWIKKSLDRKDKRKKNVCFVSRGFENKF